MPGQRPLRDRGGRRRIVEPGIADDVRRELDFHLAMTREELIAEAWSPAEADAEARRRLGDRPTIERACRAQERRRRATRRRSDMFDVLRQDLRFSLRQLASRPSFTVAALITLTLGIGAVSTMVTLVQGVLLHDLPYPDADRVVNLWEHTARGSDIRIGYPNLEDWREQSRSFEAIAHYSGWAGDTAVETDRGALTVRATSVSGEFFPVLGIQPLLGRTFTGEERQPGGPAAVVVSESFWRNHLGAPVDLDGVTLRAGGDSSLVVGVMPDAFDYPPDVQVWTNADRSPDTSDRTAHNWAAVARLRDGVSLDAARSEMNTIAARIAALHGDEVDSSEVTLRTIKSEIVGSSRRPLLFLFGASALVLLLAATNLASSLLARAIERQGEMTLRGALGAGSGRLLRQLLTESVVLTTLGGLLGTAFAYGALALLRRIDTDLPRLESVEVDGTVLLVTLAISALTGLVFGLVPALRAARVDLRSSLSSARSSDEGSQRVWNVMVASEVALALVLLVGSLMLVTELWRLLSRSTGFETRDVVVMDIAVPDAAFPAEFDAEALARLENQVARFHERFRDEVAALPGADVVALASALPLRGSNVNGGICLDSPECAADENRQAYPGYRLVSDGYFEVLAIPVLEGRAFRATDGPQTEFVAVVNRAFVERHLPDGDVLDRIVFSGGMDLHGAVPTRIVGVVGDVLHLGLDAEPTPEIFYPTAQRALRTRYASYVVRAGDGATAPLLEGLQSFLRREHPRIPPEVVTLEDIRVASVGDRRFALVVLSSLALVALGLALTGIWAVISYRVAQRRREIGVRVALGLSRRGVLRMVLSDSARLLTAGIAAGALLSWAGVVLLRSRIEGLDGGIVVFLAAATILLGAGLLASWLPARRATAIQPYVALRAEG